MDGNPDKLYKEKLGERLTRRLADALSQGAITENDASEAATYILENIDKKQTSLELLNFLEEISQRWSIFSQVLTIEEGNLQEKKDEEAINKTEDLIKQNRIDEALQVAEEANKTNVTI